MKRKRKAMRVLGALLAVLMLMQTCAFAKAPKTQKEISAKFGETTYLTGMKAWYNSNMQSNPRVSTDPIGWELSIKDNLNYIYVDVNDSLMYDLNGEAVEIEVDYFDRGKGVFTLTYEGLEDATDDSDIVDLTDTGAWKTHTFYIQDALFKNGLNKADFRIAVTSDFLQTSTYTYRSAIVFGGVRVRYADTMSPVQIKLSTEKAGNIFFEGQKIKFDVEYKNKLSEKLDLTARITAVTDGKEAVWQKEEPLTLNKKKKLKANYEFEVDKFGFYFFRVEVFDETGKYYSVRDMEFSYCTTTYGKKLNRRAGTSSHAEWTRYEEVYYGDFDIQADLTQKAGYGRHRLETGGGIGWGTTTPLVNPRHLAMLKKWQELGLDQTIILPCRLYYVPFTEGDRAWQYGPPTEYFTQVLQNQLNEVVKICAPYADSYIMGNEQDHQQNADWQKIPTNYTSWLETCWNAVRANDPDARVLAYGLTMADKEFFLGTLANGARDHMDGASVHTYASSQTYDQHDFVGRIKDYWNLAKTELGIDMMPATIGETGVQSSRNGVWAANEEANEYVKVHCIAENSPEYVECVIDYGLLCANPDSYGHLRSYRGKKFDLDVPYAPWPEYLSLSCWNNNFGGDLTPHGETKTDSYRIFKFNRISDGKDILAMWGIKKRQLLTLDLGTNEVELMDVYGNAEKLYSDDGRYTINVEEDIQYIIGDFTKYEISEDNHKWVPSVESLRVVKDNSKEITVTSPGSDLSGFTMATEDFYDTKTTGIADDKVGASVTLASLPDTQLETYLSGRPGKSQFVFHDVKKTIDEVIIKVQKDGKTYFKMPIPVKETNPINTTVKLTPKSMEEVDKWIANFTLENTMSVPLSGKFKLIEPIAWASKLAPVDFTIEAEKTQDIILDIPTELVGSVINMKAEITLEDGTVIGFSQSKDTMVAVYAKKAPVLDGVISEGEWVTAARAYISPDSYVPLMKEESFVGENDLSGYVSIMWDENNCYLLFDIKDDIHNQEFKDGATWQGDGLQYGFVMDWPGGAFTHLMAGLHTDGYSTSWVFASEKGHIPRAGYPDQFETAVKHENGRTLYEVRVDWALIMPLLNAIEINDANGNVKIEAIDDSRKQAVEGDTFRFGVLVNDDDGNGRKGYIEYGGGISNGSSSGFREIMFFGGKDEE